VFREEVTEKSSTDVSTNWIQCTNDIGEKKFLFIWNVIKVNW
jgi:hypothetical protein